VLSLVLKNKVTISEDVLTAAVFGAFRLFHEPAALASVLSLASRRGTTLDVPEFESYGIELWPQHHRGEPDARILLRHGGSVVARLLVEAKLGAEKSETGEVADDGTRGDQLARYLLAEAREHPDEDVSLVYITHHAGCPRADLDDSERQLAGANRADLSERLFWISWRDVEAVVGGLGPALPWGDLRAVFGRISMFRFQGMRLELVGPLAGRWAYPMRQRRGGAYPITARLLPLSGATWTYLRRAAGRRYAWPPIAPIRVRPEFYVGGCSHG
jgi:hypothetical protein